MTKEMKPYAFVTKSGRKVTQATHEAEKAGKAYGFFQCNAAKDKITDLLPKIREAVETPSELELSLAETGTFITDDTQLAGLAKKATHFGMNYVLSATYAGKNNQQTSDELSSIMNQAYQSSLYSDGEKFHGNIVFEKGRKYVFRE